ncbi:MAG: endonuclease/exonuclease/phosphatase family protein [Bacteroides sp.]|nr:endonuclease/exonuclease/phosphatase family protein [Bacteroides sp.]
MCLLAFSTAKAQQKELNILSYNVHNCIGMDDKRDYQRIADVILQASPDVVALLELDSVIQRNGGVFALEKLRECTGMHGIYASAIPYQGGSYGIGLLSKEAPLNHKIVPMPGREEKRTMIIAEFKGYVFCATHQSLTPEDQLLSIPILREALKGIRKPVFIAGDMNPCRQKSLSKSWPKTL